LPDIANFGTTEAVHDAARRCRLLGSFNRRSQRTSKILDVPDLQIVTADELEALCPPKKESERARIQSVLLEWQLGATQEDRIAKINELLVSKGIQYIWDDVSEVYKYDCPCCKDTGQHGWIHVASEYTAAGCWHCGINFHGLLAKIAPEIATQASESFDDPHRIARDICHQNTFVFLQGLPYLYKDGKYVGLEQAAINAMTNRYIKAYFNKLQMKTTPPVNTHLVRDVNAALAALTYSHNMEIPHWVGGGEDRPANEYLAFSNGLLHVPSMNFCDHTPKYFSLSRLPYPWLPDDQRKPEKFEQFIEMQLGPDYVNFIYEMFADCLMSFTRLRNYYLIYGIGKGGKSTLTETLEKLIGIENRCAVELQDFASDFGLEDAIGKKLILVSEATAPVRVAGVVDKIKRISGNDAVSIKQKYKKPLTVRLNAKIVVISNRFLSLEDQSGALYDRLIPIPFMKRVNNPDINFPMSLVPELPAICRLALESYQRLQERSALILPEASTTKLDELRETGTPVATFLQEKYKLDLKGFVATAELFADWETYCVDNSLDSGTMTQFIDSLKAAAPHLQSKQKRLGNNKRSRGFFGISKL
jgi:P4 family phage/plasmid primase-like protien